MSKIVTIADIAFAWNNILEEKSLHSVLFTNKLFSQNKLSPKDIKQILNEHGYFLTDPIITDRFIGENCFIDFLHTERAQETLISELNRVVKRKLKEAIEKGTDCKFSVWDRADGEFTIEEEPGEIIKVSNKNILLSNFFGFVGEIYTHKAKTNKLKTVYEIQNLNPIHYNYGLDIDFKDWKFAHIIDDYSIINDEVTSHYSWPPQILSIKF